MTSPANAVADITALSRNPSLSDPSKTSAAATASPVIDAEAPCSIVLSGSELLTLNEAQWDQLAASYT